MAIITNYIKMPVVFSTPDYCPGGGTKAGGDLL